MPKNNLKIHMEGYTIYLEYAIICQCILPELETWAIFAYKLEETKICRYNTKFYNLNKGRQVLD